jgi:hypothetical protein
MRIRLDKLQKTISAEKKEAILADLGFLVFCKGAPKIKLQIVNVTEKKDDQKITKE